MAEDNKKELEKCRKEKEDYLNGWQRAKADFLNYKKQEMERIGDILKYANEGLILKFLLILDNFEKAEKETYKIIKSHPCPELKNALQGFLQIKTQILDFLKNQEIQEINCVGEKFDPNFHEAIETIETKDQESGKIIEEIQKGYKLHNKVIRPAKVKVIK
ncbi:nucleotide exchange factor GrpE [Candidatus Parcubacteria bacterium]|nr:nucleotide exchange factor GrpE [Candidatus Parcubacteria bacterium]